MYLTESSVSINGAPVQMEQTDGSWEALLLSNFRRLYATLAQLGYKNSCGLSLEDFKLGYHYLAFDLTRSGRSGQSLVRQPTKSGTLRLTLKFSDPLPYALSLFVMSVCHSAVEIDANRSVTYSYLA